jgi:outer membrane lipoprotein-sorting protein
MVPDNPRAALIAVALGSLVALSGIGPGLAAATQQPAAVEQPDRAVSTAQQPTDETNESAPSGSEVIDRFEERVESLDTLVMTYETEVNRGENRTSSTETRRWVDYENDRTRTETETDRTHTITVRNESRTVIYDVENNEVNRFENDGDVATPELVTGLFDDTEIAFAGTERIDGERTYRLEVTRPDAATDVEQTVWLDADTYFTTRVAIDANDERDGDELVVDIRNVTLNEPIPEERFTIDIPEDAEESGYSMPEQTTYDSLDALQEGTDATITEPDVPDAYQFTEGRVLETENYHAVTLSYGTDDGSEVSVSRMLNGGPDFDYGELDIYTELDIGNRTGYYTEYEHDGGTTSVLVLPCENSTYSVFGGLSEDEITGVGESLACT